VRAAALADPQKEELEKKEKAHDRRICQSWALHDEKKEKAPKIQLFWRVGAFVLVAGPMGLEPTASGVTGR